MILFGTYSTGDIIKEPGKSMTKISCWYDQAAHVLRDADEEVTRCSNAETLETLPMTNVENTMDNRTITKRYSRFLLSDHTWTWGFLENVVDNVLQSLRLIVKLENETETSIESMTN